MQKRSCKDWECGLMRLAKALMLVALALLPLGAMAQMTMTTVQGTVYRADGTPAGGTLLINWPAFTTAQNQAVAAGSLNAAIGANGFVTVNLTPNAGALPSGSYYTATYHLNDGTVNQEYWVVPSSGTATVAAVRAQLQPSTVAVPQLASSTYVQNAIAGLSGTYLPLTGGTMTGALTLSGDPSGSTQAVTKHYVDQLAAQNLPLSGGSLTGTLTAPTLYGKNIEGGLFADQWLQAGSNNGIAMSLQQCASLPYACQVLAPNLYAQVEAQPFGTAWGMMYPPQTTGPKASDPVAQFLDQRWGVPQYVFNGARTFDSRHGAWPSFVMNFIGSSSLNGTSTHPSGALSVATNWWTGGRNFYNDKMNAETLNVQENHYAQIQGGGSIGVEVSCFGNGDCLGAGITTVSYGGPNTGSDEANEGKDEKNIEGNAVFGARAASVSAAADGTTTLTTSSPVAAGTQGAGRLLIDLTKIYNSGYISSVGSTGIICATCNWDATFGTSTQTTLTAAVQNPVNGTNSFPQSNTTLTVASSAGFAVGDLAGIFDYDYECEKVTAVPDGTHITVATDQLPHPAGAYVARGGLTCYAIEFEADRVTPSNTNGVGVVYGLNQTIRNAIPIMYSSSGNVAYLQQGYNYLPNPATYPVTRAYARMGGSGGTCSVAVSGGAVTSVSVSGGSGYISTQFPPQLVLSGISYTVAPVIYVSGIGGGGVLTSAAISNPGAGITGTPACTVVTSNPYDIYPAAKTLSVYNASAGSVDGSFVTEPWPVAPAVNDSLEQPHYFLQHTMGDFHFVGQYIPTIGSGAHTAFGYVLPGLYQGSDQGVSYVATSDASLFQGYPATPNIVGRGQLMTSTFGYIDGPWRQGWYMKTPPFAPGQTPDNPGGYGPAALLVGCGKVACSSWANAYWLAGAATASGTAGIQITPATNTVTEVAPGAGNTSCSTTLAGASGGGFSVSCGGSTSKFDASGNLALAGSVNAPGGVTGARINGEVTVDGTTYATLNAAWSAAVAQAVSTGQNQTVRLGPGTYPVTATLTEPTNGACVNLLGSSGTTMNADSSQVATTLSVPNALNGDVFFLGNANQAQGCTFKDFNVLAAGHATHGFELQWFRGLLIDNVTVNDTTA
ncbi:MAG TPA: hypothetical protein VJV22_13590, partial [Acidobacteriaceae bacterium]|nr:hypothetical protein [Acidobacteriaceae bacterium]